MSFNRVGFLLNSSMNGFEVYEAHSPENLLGVRIAPDSEMKKIESGLKPFVIRAQKCKTSVAALEILNGLEESKFNPSPNYAYVDGEPTSIMHTSLDALKKMVEGAAKSSFCCKK